MDLVCDKYHSLPTAVAIFFQSYSLKKRHIEKLGLCYCQRPFDKE